MLNKWFWGMVGVILWLFGCTNQSAQSQTPTPSAKLLSMNQPTSSELEVATFGGGCFWCTEAIFLRIKGVHRVVSGYAGGAVPNPTYKAVCTGTTGHAEVVQIHFDPKVVTFTQLLEVFFKTHDPTTLNRQGADEGTQYRSVVFYHNDAQKQATLHVIKTLTQAQIWPDKIVTEVSPAPVFYPAEDYHQNYFAQNPDQGYCRVVINPKIEKFEKVFKDLLK